MQYNSSWDLNNATTYIYVTKTGGDTTASGFFFIFENNASVFLVTNKHVAINANAFTISLGSSINESSYGYVSDICNKAIFHPDDNIDLCLVKMNDLELVPDNMTLDSLHINSIYEHMVVSRQDAIRLNYCEDVIMFSAPYGMYDTKNNLSIAYKGMTATHAGTNYYNEMYFMVDVPSWPGLSGSAIYLCNSQTMSNFANTKLLGIFYKSQYNPHSVPGKEEYIHLGRAIPAYKLLDFKNII